MTLPKRIANADDAWPYEREGLGKSPIARPRITRALAAAIQPLQKDRAPTKYPFIWYGAEKNFRDAVEIIEMNIKRRLVFTEMFRDTAQQQKLWDEYQEKVRKKYIRCLPTSQAKALINVVAPLTCR